MGNNDRYILLHTRFCCTIKKILLCLLL